MFAEMRRQDRAMIADEAVQFLARGEYGVLSLNGQNGYPHPVPISYALCGNTLWFHSAQEGMKLTDIRADRKASFCVVGDTEVLPEKFSTKYASVICYGDIIIAEESEKETGLMALVRKYAPAFMAEGEAYVHRAAGKTCVLKMEIQHISGKVRR